MSYLIKDIPFEERPRERLKKYGANNLSNEDLISILLRTGKKNKSVKELSLELLKECNMKDFSNVNYHSLSKISGLGDAKILTLIAAIEFGKRVAYYNEDKMGIKSGDDIFKYLRKDMENSLQEKFIAVFLDNRLNVLEKKVLFIGTVNESHVTPRDLFREAVKCNSVGIIVAHNHPSGIVEPSVEDIRLTIRLIELGFMLEVNVIDHLIIGKNNYYSFREKRGDLFEKKV